MNNKKQTKQPLFAEVNLTGDEFRQSHGKDLLAEVLQKTGLVEKSG